MTDRGAPVTARRPGDAWIAGAVTGVCALTTVVLLRFAIDGDGPVVRADRRILAWVVEHRVTWVDAAMRAVTTLGDVRVVLLVGIVAVAILATAARRRDLAVVLVMSSAGTWCLVNVTKRLVERPRPPEVLRLVMARGWSFPSGHAGQAAAMYLAVGLLSCIAARGHRFRWVLLGAATSLAVLIGISRIYLGVHWTSDVVAGWALGVWWFLVVLGTTTAVGGRVPTRQPAASG